VAHPTKIPVWPLFQWARYPNKWFESRNGNRESGDCLRPQKASRSDEKTAPKINEKLPPGRAPLTSKAHLGVAV
jgi:hypothetical protein